MLTGCQALPRTDVAEEAASATGIANAITFQKQGGPIDVPGEVNQTLTLVEAVRRSLAYDARIQAALARVRVGEAESQQERLLPNPILNVDCRFPEGGGQAIVETTLTGDLIAVLQKPKHISAADNRLRAASAEAITTVLEVVCEVQGSYAMVQSVESQLVVLEERRKIVERLLNLATGRLKAGEGIRLDVITLDAQRVGLAVELAQRRLERTEQRLLLARLVGEPSGAADWRLSPWESPAAVKTGEGVWVKAAIANRPEIRSRVWELAALGDEIRLTTLSPFEGGDVGVHGEHDVTWMVGPTVTTPLPIFDWGQARRAKAEAQRLVARHQLTQLQRQVVEEVRRAYASYGESRATLERAQSELMPLQEERRKQAELAYRSGEADLTTLLLAEADLQDTRAKLVELQEKVTVALVKLQRAVGGAGVAADVEASVAATQPAGESAPATRPSP
jgi:outer membrane protein TolC